NFLLKWFFLLCTQPIKAKDEKQADGNGKGFFHLFIFKVYVFILSSLNAKKVKISSSCSLTYGRQVRRYSCVLSVDVSFMFGVSHFRDISTSSKNRPFYAASSPVSTSTPN